MDSAALVPGNVMHVTKKTTPDPESLLDISLTFDIILTRPNQEEWKQEVNCLLGVVSVQVVNAYRIQVLIGALFDPDKVIPRIQEVLGKFFNSGEILPLVK